MKTLVPAFAGAIVLNLASILAISGVAFAGPTFSEARYEPAATSTSATAAAAAPVKPGTVAAVRSDDRATPIARENTGSKAQKVRVTSHNVRSVRPLAAFGIRTKVYYRPNRGVVGIRW